jgi:putative ABC transport system permease protein
MNTRWRKIAGDFRQHRLQVFGIAVILVLGTAGVVAALNARAILAREIASSYQRAKGADLVAWFDKIDPTLLDLVRSRKEVSAAEARSTFFTRVVGKTGEWFPARFTIVPDFASQNVNLIHRDNASWPTATDGLLIEQSGLPLLEVHEGEALEVRIPSGAIVRAPLSGYVHDPAVAPSTQDRMIYGFVTPAAAALLGQSGELDQLLIRLQHRGTMSDVADFGDELRGWLKARDRQPLRIDALNNTHPHAMLMTAMLRVLEVLAAIGFICSATLGACMIALWMRREVRQVGIMKTLGARWHQLAFQYLALVAPVVLVAVIVAVPIGIATSRWVVKYHQVLLNIDVADWTVPQPLFAGEIVFALGFPLIAMAIPILRAARISPRQAIQDPGIVPPRGPLRFTTRLVRVPGDRRWTFALRNTFRRPWRLALTILALSAGGALLLTAHNNYESLMRVIDAALANCGHDIEVQLQRPAPAAEIEAVARTVSDVQIAEAFRRTGVNLVSGAADSDTVRESRRTVLIGYPRDTQLLRLPLREGAWPAADATGSVVINRHVLEASPGLRLGSDITVKFRERRTKVRVIGIVDEIGGPVLYADFATFETITGLGDASSIIRVKAHDGRQAVAAGALEQALLNAKLTPGFVNTRAEFRASLEEHFAVVGGVMKMIALASALVGAISLVAMISLGVLERGREIGVIRALGGRPRSVLAIFLLEGGAVAFLSALLSIAGGIVLANALNGLAERQLLHVAVPLYLSRVGLAVLSGGVAVVILGVAFAVSRMLRVSVREALAYE